MEITINLQDDDAFEPFEPIIVNGDWALGEHLLQLYGDEHQFVPTSRMKTINMSGNTFISYVGTLAVSGKGAVLYMTNVVLRHKDVSQCKHYTIDDIDGDLSQYIVDEEYCFEEDWRE